MTYRQQGVTLRRLRRKGGSGKASAKALGQVRRGCNGSPGPGGWSRESPDLPSEGAVERGLAAELRMV